MFKPKSNVKSNFNIPPFKDEKQRWRTMSLFYETYPHGDGVTEGYMGLDMDKYLPIYTLQEFDLELIEGNRFYTKLKATLNDPGNDIYSKAYIPQGTVTIPSLRRLYVDLGDIKEHRFALKYIGSWHHWKHLCGINWFKPYLEEWRQAIDAKLQSDATKVLCDIAKGPDAKLALAAAKWLAEGGYREKVEKGRPSAVQVRDNLKKESQIQKIYDEDLERLGLSNYDSQEDKRVQ